VRQLLVISGKGGTGKTTLVSSFASLGKEKVLADCDVDASDLGLILDPEIEESEEFMSKEAVKEEEKCTDCGLCFEHCRFDAINSDYEIDSLLCEGCGACAFVCPQEAIKMEDRVSGHFFNSTTRYGPMAHAELIAGGETTGKLVTIVKENAQKLAEEFGRELILIDGSPGMGCPVISSLAGVDAALIVTEPTLSGIHDLKRVLGVAQHFGVKPLVCINKYDLSLENTEEIQRYLKGEDVPLIGKIPYDSVATEAMVEGKSVVEYSDGETAREIERIWDRFERVV